MLMQDASWNNQAILQWLSNCDTRWSIDGEVGDLADDLITNDPDKKGLLTYLRYNLWLDAATLKQLMNKDYTAKEIDDLVEMSNADSRQELYKIGEAGAKSGEEGPSGAFPRGSGCGELAPPAGPLSETAGGGSITGAGDGAGVWACNVRTAAAKSAIASAPGRSGFWGGNGPWRWVMFKLDELLLVRSPLYCLRKAGTRH